MNEPARTRSLSRLDESLIADLPPFSKLARHQIRAVLDAATCRRYAEGATFFEEGQNASRFFLSLDGVTRVIRITEEGEQVIAIHIPSGQLFGIARAIGRDTYPATAVAASECLTLEWPTSLWDGFVAEYPGFSTETYRTIGHRLGEMNARIVELATQQVEQRVATALLQLANQTGRKTGVGIEIGIPVTRQDLSEMTGTTLHTVSRLLSAWGKAGYVESARRRITVVRPHALMEISSRHRR